MGMAVPGLDTPRGDRDAGYQGDRGAVPGLGTLRPIVWGYQGWTAPRVMGLGRGLSSWVAPGMSGGGPGAGQPPGWWG